MKVKQFRYSIDNLGYLVYGPTSAMAVDGGAVDEILDFVRINNLHLKYVTNTHSHMDHTIGNRGLLDGTNTVFLDCKTFPEKTTPVLDGEEIHVYHTPGHTRDSISFHLGDILITGDTLFQGKVGRCFSGDLKGFFSTLADEYKINPFLRFNQEKIISILSKKGLPVKTEYDRWESIMSLL